MMVTHLTATRSVLLVALALRLLLPSPAALAQAPRAGGPGVARAPARSAIRIAVLPFRNSLARQPAGSEDAAVLGDGIADGLTNALKGVAGLSVIDSEIVLRAASRFQGAEVAVKDADAVQVAEALTAQFIVVGSFQLSRDHLRVDARVLTVAAEAGAPARPLTADAAYPAGYSALLAQLTNAILASVNLTAAGTGESAGTRSQEAFRHYVRGTRKAREDNAASLSEAIEHFRLALALDPRYADALAARSEAETRLYELKKARGEDDAALAAAAMDDARGAVESAPRSGRSHRASARAKASRGDYAGAAQSAAAATRAWPGDVGSALDRLRALGRGGLTRTAETDRFLLDHPDVALLLPELPKVRALNNSDLPLIVRFIPDVGRPYPPISIGAGATRIVPLFAGSYRVVFESQAGNLERREVLDAGRDYELVFTADIPAAAFVFVNGGNSHLQISVSGPQSTSLSLGPRETKTLRVPPGGYTVTGRLRTAVTSGRFELQAGAEETITYTYTGERVPTFNPSRLTITNSGNGALSIRISGPRSLTVSVPPGGKTVTLPAGIYTIRAACGRDVSEAEEYELSSGEDATIDRYSCNIRYYRRTRP